MPRTYASRILQTCQTCGTNFTVKASVAKKGGGRFCSRPCQFAYQSREPLGVRFQRFVGPRTETGCLPWTGKKNRVGYGSIKVGNGDRTMVYAHRVAWELVNGPIPEGLCILHSCDHPWCVAVEHLSVGTHKENSEDCKAKGRNTRGEGHWSNRLTDQQVIEIRERYANRQATQVQLAAEFGIGQGTISHIVLKKIWKHLP